MNKIEISNSDIFSENFFYAFRLFLFRFAAGYGFFMFLQGITYLTIGPFVGWIRDYTQSYELFLHMLTFLIVLCVIFWFIEIIWFKNTSKKELNTSN